MKIIFLIPLLCFFTSCTKNKSYNEKIFYDYSSAKIKTLDPIYASDVYSINQIKKMYDGLLQYHYLKRPYQLIPNLAKKMPKVSQGGKVYEFEIKEGVFFHDNKCFPGGKGRELVAADFVYSFKRVADPKLVTSYWDKNTMMIKGLKKWRKENQGKDKTDYSKEVEGLKAIGKYHLRIELTQANYQFLDSLPFGGGLAVPKEAVDFYQEDFINNPVGTGPFMLEDFTQRNKLVFKKNPTYRQDHYPSEGEKGDQEKGLLKAAGKRLPFLDKIIVSISEESTAGWLNFMGGNLDIFEVPNDKVDSVIINDQLPQELIDKGIIYASHAGLSTAFYAFNHEDPLFQGEKGLNLRRAISLAIDKEKLLKLIYGGLGEVAQSFLPNGIEGNISHLQSPYSKSDLKKAKELFKKTGQKMGLNITVETVSSTFGRNLVEFFRRELAQIGIELKAEYYTWPKLLERIKQAKTQSFFMSYVAASPDGGSLLSRFHSKEEGRIILYQSSEFDRLYEKAMTMPQSRERTKLYIKINQLLAKDVPVVFLIHKKNPLVRQAWLKNYKHGKFFNGNYKYYDIDLDVKKKLLK